MREVERLKVFYAELAQHHLAFATPDFLELAQIEASVVSIERELVGTPLERSAATDDSTVTPAVVDCLMEVLRGLASVPGASELARLPVLGESEPLWKGYSRWGTALAALLERRVSRSGPQLRRAVEDFDRKLDRIVALLEMVTPRSPAVIHGDLVPANVLVNELGRPTAVLDFGFLSTVGDPAFDAAIAASTFDMYGPHAARTEAVLTREVVLQLGYPLEELTLYKAAYAVATSTAYDPNGQDGHFLWCAQILRRDDVVDLLLG
jgi:aminoglycoside phosphotransferase (APT) family kinase protein